MSRLALVVTESLYRRLGHVAITLDELHLWGTLKAYNVLNTGEVLYYLTLSKLQASDLPDSAGMGSGLKGALMPLVGIKEPGQLESLVFHVSPSCPVALSGMPIILGQWSVEQKARFDGLIEGSLRVGVKGGNPFSSWYRPELIDSEFPCTCAGS